MRNYGRQVGTFSRLLESSFFHLPSFYEAHQNIVDDDERSGVPNAVAVAVAVAVDTTSIAV